MRIQLVGFKMNLFKSAPSLACLMVACILAVSASSGRAQTTVPVLVKYDFENALAPENSPDSNSAVVFTGNVGPYTIPGSGMEPVVPQAAAGDKTYMLAESGFGSTFASNVPYSGYEADVIKKAQRLLYYDFAENDTERKSAAFRYLVLLYGPDTGSADSRNLSREERSAKAFEDERREAEITDFLKKIASTRVPTSEEYMASLPKNIIRTDLVNSTIEHERKVLEHKVAYAKRRLSERDARVTRLQSGLTNDASTVRCNFESMDELYGDEEKERAQQGMAILRDGLKYAPMSPAIAKVYLDAFYDKAVAELQFVKQAKVDRAGFRLGIKTDPTVKFAIDKEIQILESGVLQVYEDALNGLSEMLAERGGVDVTTLDSSYPAGTPMGYYVFKREEPTRNKYAANWKVGEQILPVPSHDETTSTEPVFEGFKDYVMILQIMSDYLRDSADLARLYTMRGIKTSTQDDRQKARELMDRVEKKTAMDAKLLENMFKDYDPPPGDASGVFAARQGIISAMGEITGVRNFMAGKANSLGFDPNFLILIQEFQNTTSGNQFDSYDALVQWITFNEQAPLKYAETLYDDAVSAYEQYRGTADELFSETASIQDTLNDRYFEIVGADDIDSLEYTPLNPEPGSELGQSLQRLRELQQKRVGLANMSGELQNGINTATDLVQNIIPGKFNAINQCYTKYANSVSPEYDTLTQWSSTAAGTQALYDTLADSLGILTGGDIFGKIGAVIGSGAVAGAGAANTIIQIMAAIEQGNAQKHIDLAQAGFDADMAKTDIAADRSNAELELSSLRRDMISNSIESDGLMAQLAQEQAHYVSLLREIQRIKQEAQENLQSLSDRYFSDPIHQLKSNSAQVAADNAFRDAQKWVFFTQRALEYKWNTPFVFTDSGGKSYDSGSIQKIRNFKELNAIFAALNQFNLNNNSGGSPDRFLDVISLKEDIFGYKDGVLYSSTAPDGTSITINSETAFRNRLATLVNSTLGSLEIPINTFGLKKSSGTFFTGPKYYLDGTLAQAGTYLDKILWMKFSIVSDGAPSGGETLTGNYSYGGTSYIRTRRPSNIDLDNDRVIANEFRQFPFRYYYLDPDTNLFAQLPTQEGTVPMEHTRSFIDVAASEAPPANATTFLKERSVAATQQRLTIVDASRIDISKVKDIRIYVEHQSRQRLKN